MGSAASHLEIIRRDRLAPVGLVVIVLFGLIAVFGPWIAPHDPTEILTTPEGRVAFLHPPSRDFWFGTTNLGRDVFSQVVMGTRVALIVGLLAAVLVTIVGTLAGLIAGYYGGWADDVLMRAVDVAYAIPFEPFIIVLVGILRPSIWNVILAITLITWRSPARVVRAQVLSLVQRPYIKAARAAGAGHGRILARHIAPNILPLAFLYVAITAGWAITAEASISFLGFGDPRLISWGQILHTAFLTGSIRVAWWWVVPPGVCIMLVVLAIFFISRAYEQIANPRLRAFAAVREPAEEPGRPAPGPRTAVAEMREPWTPAAVEEGMPATPLLQVEDLEVHYSTPAGPLVAVGGVSFTLQRGEALGIVGESGCGKSTLARALLRILPPQGAIVRGRINLEGTDLVRLAEPQMRRVRWERIAMVPQSSMNALNPVHRVGEQIVEALRSHRAMSAAVARRRAAELLQTVGIEERRFTSYPHQLSGGQRQRAVIAMALALEPQVLITDEPTTALDVITQHGIVRELIRLRGALGIAILYISHDVSVVAQTCDRIAVMYAGRFAEVGPTRQVLHSPHHPYTMGLRNAFPDLRRAGRLVSIPGAPPSLIGAMRGCPFQPRCPFAAEVCETTTPPLAPTGSDHLAACHRAPEASALRPQAEDEQVWERVSA